MTDPKGSVWRKWDLHVHTPASLVNNYGPNNDDTWEKFIADLEQLSPEYKVLGINDYIFLDGYERVLDFKNNGRLQNIDVIFPVIELRIDKFGGTESNLRRVNLHIIFSNELKPEVIQQQFLNALPSAYQLEPQYSDFARSWHAVATKDSLSDLGRMIIESVPTERRSDYGSPLKEGFYGINFNFDKILEKLRSHYFRGKYLTAVGKTEWANIRWNDQSIAEKKNIINSVHFVFISCESLEEFKKAKDSLEKGGVNNRLLDCSDAHIFSDSKSKDRIGKCFTWIKSDTTFEGLKHAFYEPEIRIYIDEKPPLDPIFKVEKVKFNFPQNSKIGDEPFCLRGETEINFSPNLTCLIGGRGVGKSMILNLIHEKLYPGENTFFKYYRIENVEKEECVDVIGTGNIEFLSQNEIEAFAIDQEKFTHAIFNRLIKLDKSGDLNTALEKLRVKLKEIDTQISLLNQRITLNERITEKNAQIEMYKKIIDFLQDDEYKNLSSQLRSKTENLEEIRSSSRRLASLVTSIQKLQKDYAVDSRTNGNAYSEFIASVVGTFKEIVQRYMSPETFKDIRAEETRIQGEITDLQESLERFLSTKELSTENLVDISRANQQLAFEEKELEELEYELEIVNTEIASFNVDLTTRTEYEKIITLQLMPISERLRSIEYVVKSIGLEYKFDSDRARENILKSFMNRFPPDEKGAQYREDYVEHVLFCVNPENLPDLESFMRKIDEVDKSIKTATAIKQFFETPDNYEIYKLLALREFLNVDKYKTVTVSYDGRDLKDTSFGQRCTAAIIILLLLGNTPLIVDEPEAHLDSSLIADYLVRLIKKQKQSRQIIFATHNANFVVNGDSELINVLTMDSDKITKITPTTLENIKHRDHIVALEGGEEAFKHRDKKYEFLK